MLCTVKRKIWYSMRESNSRQLDVSQLYYHYTNRALVETVGIEPTAACLQSTPATLAVAPIMVLREGIEPSM